MKNILFLKKVVEFQKTPTYTFQTHTHFQKHTYNGVSANV